MEIHYQIIAIKPASALQAVSEIGEQKRRRERPHIKSQLAITRAHLIDVQPHKQNFDPFQFLERSEADFARDLLALNPKFTIAVEEHLPMWEKFARAIHGSMAAWSQTQRTVWIASSYVAGGVEESRETSARCRRERWQVGEIERDES
ncbi:hypothetical protein ACLOJK_039941 [Asimina triloba]